MTDFPELAELASILIAAADDTIMPQMGQVVCSTKSDGSPVTDVDVSVQDAVRKQLQARWPAIGFLGEETSEVDQQNALNSGRIVWCLDPLDGTTNYATGIPLFSVSLALISGDGCELGLVYDPVRKELFSARRDQGACLNGQLLSCKSRNTRLDACVGAVDFKRLPPKLRCRLAEKSPFRSQRNIGTVALEWCWMAAGRFQLYLHGGQKLWDYAAGDLIFREAGGVAQTLEGEAIFSHSLSPRSAIAAGNQTLFHHWRDTIRTMMNED